MDNMLKQVVSMLVSSEKITLFTIAGELIEIKNDDENYDTAKIAEFLTPKLSGLGAVEINLTDFTRVRHILPSDLEEHGITITQIINGQEVQGIFYPRKTAVQVTVGENKVTIPDVENLSGHIQRAVNEKSPSVANFLKRLAPVIQERQHSGEDLMKFIKKSEMPLTNDGRIIAYKRVAQGHKEGYYVDVHTKSVTQRVGSRVTMDVDLVDPSRHNSCSVGLHVANLGYLRGFSGAYTLIVLVNPEDFIAVPKGEDTKARVCAYEIIGVMSSNSQKIIDNGNHVTGDDDLQALIKKAVEGNAMKPLEIVKVGKNGGVVSTTPLTLTLTKPIVPVATSSGKSLKEDAPVEKEEPRRDTLAVARAAQAATVLVQIPDEVLEAFELLLSGVSKQKIADKFLTSSRSIGRWMDRWGYQAWYEAQVAAQQTPPETTSPDEWDNQEDLEAAAAFYDAVVANGGTNEGMGTMMPTKEEAPVSDEDFAKLVQSSEAPKITKADQMLKLYNAWVLGGFSPLDLEAIKAFKSKAKKSYNALGLTRLQEEKINNAG